nr:oplophorus-luciferin 2-monooxygenase non-catalytic subunit-like [Procambarus clarkii]
MELVHTLIASLLLVLNSLANTEGDAPARSYFDHIVGGYFSDAVGGFASDELQVNVEAQARPCPNDADLSPCSCTVHDEDNFVIDLDCSEVESEEQLATIMRSPFPFVHFRNLTIDSNPNVVVLRRGVLANITFQEFYITGGALTEVETGALSGSSSTAISMHFEGNDIAVFPWGELSLFTALVDLDVSDNSISTFPALISDSLKYLDLSNNSLGLVPSIAFRETPLLEEIYLNGVNMLEILPGTFSGLHYLRIVSVNSNEVSSVPEGAIQFTTVSRFTEVHLSDNNIRNVAANAITGVTNGGDLFLDSNELEELKEEVWKPLLELGARLHLQDNPLTCGCDIAWIMMNSPILALIDDRTTCSDGELMINLNPDIFVDLCY